MFNARSRRLVIRIGSLCFVASGRASRGERSEKALQEA
jgi:hypothetical protein